MGGYAPKQRRWRAAWMVLEALGFTFAAVCIADGLGAEQAGVFSIFLASASLAGRLSKLLDSNRKNYERGLRGWHANPLTTFGILALFVGVMFGYAAAAALLDARHVASSFRFALELAHADGDSILSARFPSVGSLCAYNCRVLVAVFILGFLYRAYGLMLALSWNACIWGVVMVFLVRRGMILTTAPAHVFLAYSAAAVLPHLLLEALAYVECGLASVFFSLAITNYGAADPRMRRMLRAASWLMAFSFVTLVVAAVLEAHLPRWLLARFR